MPRLRHIVGPLLVSALLLTVIELGLRVAGFEVPVSAGGDARLNLLPLFKPRVDGDGKTVLQRSDAPIAFPRQKAPQGFRVFVVGESSVFGFPFGPDFAFVRHLQDMLAAALPGRAVEVINSGVPAIASWHARQIVDEISHYAPDLVVIYTGHNDWINPGPELIPRYLRIVSRARLYQLALFVNTRWRTWRYGVDKRSPHANREAYGYARDRSHGRETMRRRDREWVHMRFRDNLRAMVAAARAAGANVLVASLAQNLRDFPPAASRHRRGLAEAERERWRTAVEQADRARQAGDCRSALADLRTALRIDRRPALVHYARGRCLETLGRYASARAAYRRASDLDEVPLGAPSDFNDLIRQTAAETGARYLDVAGALARRSAHGLLGEELFFDHVHPTLAGHVEIARVLGTALGAPGTALPDPRALAAERPELQTRAHLSNMLLYLMLGWYDDAMREVDAMGRPPKFVEFVENARAEDPDVPARTDFPNAMD